MHTLDDFLLKREDLAFKISKLTGILGRLGVHERCELLTRLEDDCHKANFRVLIAGEFKRGKSCLINAMLGDSILPMKVAPCTTTISEVHYGELPTALIENHTGEINIDYEERFRYCTIQGQRLLPDEIKPIHKVRIAYPSPLCKKGLTLIDSPGLNEDWSRTQTSLREIAQADVLILVLSCEMALSQSEQQFIQSHLLPYRDRLFFVWNRADAIWDKPEEEAALKKRSDEHLSQHSDQIYFVSAREGLLGKIQQDEDRWTTSQIPTLLEQIESFAVQQQAHDKLERFWQQAMQSTTYTLFQVIPRMEHLLESSTDSVQEYQQAIETLESVETKRLFNLSEAVQSASTNILSAMEKLWDQFIANIPEQIQKDAHKLKFAPRIARQEREDIIIDWFNQWLQQALHTFSQNSLRNEMEQEIESLKLRLDELRMEHIRSVEEAIHYDTDEIQLFSGRWVEETSILITTALSLMLLKIDRDHIEKDLLKVRALRGWLMGSHLSDRDMQKLSEQLQRTLSSEQEGMMTAQREHLSSTMKNLQQSLERDIQLTRVDVAQQIDTVLKLHKTDKQDTHLEQHKLQLETLRLSVHTMHSQLRSMLNNL